MTMIYIIVGCTGLYLVLSGLGQVGWAIVEMVRQLWENR